MHKSGILGTVATGMLVLTLGLGLTGCQQGNDAQEVATESEAAATDGGTQKEAATTDSTAAATTEAKQVLGTESASNTEVALTNSLAKDLNSLSLRASGEAEYAENLIPAGSTVKAGEEVRLFVDLANQPADSTYDIRVTTADDGSVMEFTAVPLANIKSVSLKNDGTAFAEYVTTSGSTGTTKAADAVEAQADTQATQSDNASQGNNASTQAYQGDTNEDYVEMDASGDYASDYEEPSYEEPVYAEPSYDEPTYEEPVVEEVAAPVDEAPVYEEPVVDQSSDACQGDVVLRD
ncbi:MAG: hypothetical protein IKG18_04115 [Atopobiaceae bacterium]|nr:hypothetical protein [Atopobiaceae bacterium]